MTKLADKIEALEGPSREVDCEIAVHALGYMTRPNKGFPDKTDYGYLREDGGEVWPGHGGAQLVPTFTASLDAAMTLVPDGWEWTLYSDGSCDLGHTPETGCLMATEWTSDAATPALALCAAALRAREASK